MSGSFQQSTIHGSSAQTQSNTVNISKCLTSNSTVVTAVPSTTTKSFVKMPVTTSSLSQVLRMPSFQDLQSLPSLRFSVACATPSYVFSDNGFDSSHGMYSKRGKGSPVAAETLSQSSSVQHQSLQQRPLSHSTPSSVPSPHSPYSPVKEEKESQPFQGSKSEFERRQLNAIEKTPSNQFGSVMLIAVPSYQENGVVSRTESHPSSSFTSGPISSGTMVLTNHHPVLRYPPNGDTLLSTSAISYGDGDILPEGNFDVHVGSSLGSLEDGLLSGNLGVSGDGGSGPSGFDLFDGEPRQESYLNDGNQEMQISSQTFPNASESFGLSDSGSNMSTLQDTAAETAISGEGVASKCSIGGSKLTVTTILDKVKAKSRPSKAVSPNRTTTQTCAVCGKVFSNSSALAKHKLTHSDERKYVCHLCTKAFKRQDHLNGHMLTHMNKKPYECKVEGCGKSYCDARSLRRHNENHHSAANQASAAAAAAAAAAVNAISVRVGGTPITLPFISDGKVEGHRTSFLATALQSDRIRYAPPQTVHPSGTHLQPYTTPVSSATGGKTSTGPSTIGALALTTTSSSAAGQLQLLAFQQQEQQQQSGDQENVLSWKQASTLFGSNNVRPPTCPADSQQSSTGRQQSQFSSVEQSTTQTSEIPEGYLGQSLVQNNFSQENSSGQPVHITGIFSQSAVLPGVDSISDTLNTDMGDTLHLRGQWAKAGSSYLTASAASAFLSEPKPVECNICQRKFKNVPALNGHMRLHGGYLKKEVDVTTKKVDKKVDSRPHQPPLQTASVNIRALIEEKIIQRRITNPPLSATIPTSSLLPPPSVPPHPLPSSLVSSVQRSFVNPSPSSFPSTLEATANSDLDPPNHEELMAFAGSCINEPLMRHLPPNNRLQVPLDEVSSSSLHNDSSLQDSELLFQQQQVESSASYQRSSEDDDAQSDMQRQIEIIKQGLMSHQPPLLEKFRRHSDSDHFLAPRSYHLGSLSPSSVTDFLRRKVSGKRTQRTGSDPGEFSVGNLEEMFSGTLVEMDECSPAGDVGDEVGDDELQAMQTHDTLPTEDMIEFEIVSGDEGVAASPPLPNFSSSQSVVMQSTPTSCIVVNAHSEPLSEDARFNDASLTSVTIPKVKVEEDDDVFLSPSSIPTSPIRTKKKHRPEPLYIPPHASTCGFQSRLRSPRLWDSMPGGRISSPPPYTPPPMLSPVRSAPGLFWHVINNSGSLTPKSAPLTPGKLGLSQEISYLPDPEEEVSDPPETDILPHVNIGSQFQAALPVFRGEVANNYNPKFEDLIWDPKCVECLSDKELEMYLEFACCAAIPGGGRNKEYALHVLYMHGGNLQEAVLSLMDPAPKLLEAHPLLEYNYAESDRWTTEEIELYHQALLNFDKDFFSIAHEVKTKSVKECIQFYYLWKKICPDEYKRLRTIRRKRELEGGQYNLRSKLGDDGINDGESSRSGDSSPPPVKQPDVSDRFFCDYPDCLATFSSRQALNGHIRIHGGNNNARNSFGNRSRSPATADDVRCHQNSSHLNTGSNALGQFGDATEGFPCKICGKVFFKVKSRSAHMKSHRPLDPDRQK